MNKGAVLDRLVHFPTKQDTFYASTPPKTPPTSTMASALALSQVIARLSALEEKVASLETENLLLKRALLSAPAPASAPAPSGKGKKAAAAGASKSHAGPVAWNEEVLAVWMEMASANGIDVSDEANWRKEAQAMGIGRTEAMKEASARRGPKPEKPVAAKKVSEKPVAPAAASLKKPSAALLKKAPPAPKPSAEEVAAAALAKAKAEFEEMGLSEVEIEGQAYFTSSEGEVFLKAGEYMLGERAGVLTAEGTIDPDA